MIILNGLVLNQQGEFQLADLWVKGDRIKQVNYERADIGSITKEQLVKYLESSKSEENDFLLNEEIIDAKQSYVIPGLIDTHIHGAVGHDFCDQDVEGLSMIASHLKKNGITAFCPTSMTLEAGRLEKIFETANASLSEECAEVVGIHMEGPFLSKAKKGAQNEAYLRIPSIELFHKLSAASQHKVKIVTIAPEVEGAMEFIDCLKNEVSISIGHTTANYEIAQEAFSHGANRATHLYNAMAPFSHRDPGVVGAAFDATNAYVELICDGIHVHESVIRSTFQMFGEDSVVLISDAMMAMGMEAGEYELGGQKVYMKDKKAVLADGTIAGSATNLMDCLRNCVQFGIPLEKAVKAATQNPAKSIGIFDEMGSVEAGKKANLVILNHKLEIQRVVMNGR